MGCRLFSDAFPVRLPEMYMRLHGVERIRRAMDPFVGLGSSALAAQSLGIDFIGFDIDEVYLDYARSCLAEPSPPSLIDAAKS